MATITPPAISLVVLNYNGRQWLEQCLTAAHTQLSPQDELILVDNASDDGSVDLVRARFPRLQLLALERNLGFAGGNNAGARIASGSYLVFLNNDAVPQDGWLAALKNPFDRDRSVGLTTSRLVYLHDPSTIDSAGDGYLRAGGAFKRFHGEPSALGAASGEVFGACGAAFMIRRSLFQELGGFDDDFFMVYEDVDLSYRARLRGHRCFYVSNAVVHHAGSGTLKRASDAAVFFGQRNLEWTYWKNTPTPLLLRTFVSHVLYDAAALMGYGASGRLGPYLRAKWAALRGIPAVLRKRALVQKSRVTTNSELWDVMESNWFARKRKEKRFDRQIANP